MTGSTRSWVPSITLCSTCGRLPHREVAAAIRTARASTVPLAVRLAFEFLVLTAARWGEVRWAEWTEIDRDEGVWTVPARRTKANREHRVPLCGRALEILVTRHLTLDRRGDTSHVSVSANYLLGKQLEDEATASGCFFHAKHKYQRHVPRHRFSLRAILAQLGRLLLEETEIIRAMNVIEVV